MIIEKDIEQGSPEWFRLRCGSPGASSFDKIVTSTGKRSSQREKFMYQMAGEILTGEKEETYTSAAMARGTELEPEARSLFEMVHGVEVEEVGLCYPDALKLYHVSPDGLIPNIEKGLEIKCPSLSVAVEYLAKNKLPAKYVCQVQGSLMVTGYKSWFFVSYYPGLKPLILEIERDEKLITVLKEEIETFCAELMVMVKDLQ